MPPAQGLRGLLMMAHVHEGMRPLAPRMSALLLRLYVAAVRPISLWLAFFISRLGSGLLAPV